jgi:hypothetical protein
MRFETMGSFFIAFTHGKVRGLCLLFIVNKKQLHPEISIVENITKTDQS